MVGGWLVKVTRRYTQPDISPYSGVTFQAVFVDAGASAPVGHGESGGACASSQPLAVEFPGHWSAATHSVCLENRFFADGIVCNLSPVAEDDVPGWLWRRQPADAVVDDTTSELTRETSLRQVIDRMAGSWCYHGWNAGYFDTEADARTFYDECRWLLVHQRLSPPLSHWRQAGRYWAYGQATADPSTYVTDYRTGRVRRAEPGDLPPHRLAINATRDALDGDGGIWDLWRRESAILSGGGHCGVNLSNLSVPGNTDGDTAFADILDVGDTMARTACPGRPSERPKRRVTVDSAHPQCEAVIRRPGVKAMAVETEFIGRGLARRHVQAILDACATLDDRGAPAPRDSAGLHFAIQSARLALLPDALINRTVDAAERGVRQAASILFHTEGQDGATDQAAEAREAVPVIAVTPIINGEPPAEDGPIDAPLEAVAANAWRGIECGLQNAAVAEAWNSCAASGPIRSASGDGSFMFLDDTAADPWLIGAPGFLESDGTFDVAGYQHAVELAAIAADLSVMVTASVTPRLARRVWDFRPLALSVSGLGQSLLSTGLSYDSSAGRAFGAGLCALLTSTAYRVSAQLASELGSFPDYAKNAGIMETVLERHSDMVANCIHDASPAGLVEAIESAWSDALRIGRNGGFRNAHVSVLCEETALAAVLECGSTGLAPVAELVTNRQASSGYCEKHLNPAVPRGLRSLGYTDAQIDAITRHVVGHGTLARAPGVNHETLRKRGFTKAAIDAVEMSLTQADHISLAFQPFVIGEDYCRHMLGFTEADLSDDGFDLLAALGFSDAGIEAANIFCCGAGTLEGAPALMPEHLSVFDGMEPQGARGNRCVGADAIVKMMGAVQPHISGAIGQAVALPAGASLDECRGILDLALGLKVKSITLKRRLPAEAAMENVLPLPVRTDPAPRPLAITPVGPAPAVTTVNEANKDAEAGQASPSLTEIAVADEQQSTVSDAEASRRALSHAARSTASVTSSADAVVEQRHV